MLSQIVEYHRLSAIPRLVGRQPSTEERKRQEDLGRTLRLPEDQGGRRWKRQSLVRQAEIWTWKSCTATMLLDVSAGGFRVTGDHDLPVNSFVDLLVTERDGATYRFPCRVVWTSPGRNEFGLALDGLPGAVPSGVRAA